jgi:hypothetical protein
MPPTATDAAPKPAATDATHAADLRQHRPGPGDQRQQDESRDQQSALMTLRTHPMHTPNCHDGPRGKRASASHDRNFHKD